jgi:uncharacterized protein YxjI
MAGQFCVKCGNPLPADAQFCNKCGTPTAAASAAATPAQPAAPAAAATPPTAYAGPPLGQLLGVKGTYNFLLQHVFFTGGRSYRVMNTEKKQLFSIHENVAQEQSQQMGGFGNLLAAQGMRVGQFGQNRSYAWNIVDASNAIVGHVTFNIQGYNAAATLTDAQGAPIMTATINRGLMGKMTANANFPDGRPMFSAGGNLIHRTFSILDPGNHEMAKIHEKLASARDTYNLDLLFDIDPVAPLIFAIIIDREKERN